LIYVPLLHEIENLTANQSISSIISNLSELLNDDKKVVEYIRASDLARWGSPISRGEKIDHFSSDKFKFLEEML